jgi:hypothetical protein
VKAELRPGSTWQVCPATGKLFQHPAQATPFPQQKLPLAYKLFFPRWFMLLMKVIKN